jgi:hypothetical protein
VLDPFSVYAQGEDVLRQELSALNPGHLTNIIEAYDLAGDTDLRTLSEPALVELIVQGVRREARPGGEEQGLGTSG